MAIGDAVALYMGTAVENRQPSAGVEEQITAFNKSLGTDALNFYDGTTALMITDVADRTILDLSSTEATRVMAENMAYMITNTIYLRKSGTTDRIVVMGVQTNA